MSSVKFLSGLQTFAKHPGMFIDDSSYEAACALIVGLNLACDNKPLIGMDEWIQKKWGRYSQQYWGAYLKNIYKLSNPEATSGELIGFLTEQVQMFVESK